MRFCLPAHDDGLAELAVLSAIHVFRRMAGVLVNVLLVFTSSFRNILLIHALFETCLPVTSLVAGDDVHFGRLRQKSSVGGGGVSDAADDE